jgi:hypothetical protein
MVYRHQCSSCKRETEDPDDYRYWTWINLRPAPADTNFYEQYEVCPECFVKVLQLLGHHP